jgi:hypothetical protein
VTISIDPRPAFAQYHGLVVLALIIYGVARVINFAEEQPY